MLTRLVISFLWLLINHSNVVLGQRVLEHIYTELKDNAQCFRIMNGTHQIGCQSSRYGDVGVVHLIENETDMQWINDDPGGHSPFVVLLNVKLWNHTQLILGLKDNQRVSGVILLWQDTADITTDPGVAGYSPDHSCPNPASGLYPETEACGSGTGPVWNPQGRGVWFEDWKKPVFLLTNNTEIETVRDYCYAKFNKPINGQPASYPLCATRLQMWNLGALNSESCLRRSQLFDGLNTMTSIVCSALKDSSLFAFVPSTNKSDDRQKFKNDSVLVLASRMDSFSMFSDTSPGAQSALTGLISLLAVAEALGRNKTALELFRQHGYTNNKFLLFLFLHGESLDYIGSSRVVWDMNTGTFPNVANDTGTANQSDFLKMNHLGFFLELNQLGLAASQFLAHVDGTVYSEKKQTIDNMVGAIGRGMKAGTVRVADQSSASILPPASYQRFLKSRRTLPGLVLTDFDKSFKSRFYNSFLDRSFQFQDSLSKDLLSASQGALNAAVEWVANGTNLNMTINPQVVNDLIECFIKERDMANCSLTSKLFDKKQKMPWGRTYITATTVSYLTSQLLSWFLGAALDEVATKENCTAAHFTAKDDEINTYAWMKDLRETGNYSSYVCVKTPAQSWIARSPAFDIEDYDWRSHEYSTWTESVWGVPMMQVYLKANPYWEGAQFSIGLLVFILSAIAVWTLYKRAEILFGPTPVAV